MFPRGGLVLSARPNIRAADLVLGDGERHPIAPRWHKSRLARTPNPRSFLLRAAFVGHISRSRARVFSATPRSPGLTRPPDPSLRDHRNRQRELALQEPLLTRRRRSLRPGCPGGSQALPHSLASHVAGHHTKPRGSPIDDRDNLHRPNRSDHLCTPNRTAISDADHPRLKRPVRIGHFCLCLPGSEALPE